MSGKTRPSTLTGGAITSFVVPDGEVRDLDAADAGNDADVVERVAFVSIVVLETGAALFDGREVKRRGVGDGLDFVGSVIIAQRIAVRFTMSMNCGNVSPKSGLPVLR